MESTPNQFLAQISKKIQGHLLIKEFKFTADYLLGALNKEVDTQLRTMKATTMWKLSPGIHQKLGKKSGGSQTQTFLLLEILVNFQVMCLGIWVHKAKKGMFFQKDIVSPFFFKKQGLAQSFDRSRNINFHNVSMANSSTTKDLYSKAHLLYQKSQIYYKVSMSQV